MSCNTAIAILVLTVEKFHDPRLVISHPLKILKTPNVEIKRSQAFNLKQRTGKTSNTWNLDHHGDQKRAIVSHRKQHVITIPSEGKDAQLIYNVHNAWCYCFSISLCVTLPRSNGPTCFWVVIASQLPTASHAAICRKGQPPLDFWTSVWVEAGEYLFDWQKIVQEQ